MTSVVQKALEEAVETRNEEIDRLKVEIARLESVVEGLRGVLNTEVSPGDRIGDAGCPICGAGLRIEHGDEEGQIAVLANEVRNDE